MSKTSGTRQIVLSENQTEHVNRIVTKILPKYEWFLDSSPTGTGKTVTTVKIFQLMLQRYGKNCKLVVIVPPAAKQTGISPWKREAKKYGVDIILLSYNDITGSVPGFELGKKEETREFELPKDNEDYQFIKRIDHWDPKAEYKGKAVGNWTQVDFEPTQKWIKFCRKHNVLLIEDEAHNVKNQSGRNKSSAALIKGLNLAKKKNRAEGNGIVSYFGFLTATPFDKKESPKNFFMLVGAYDEGSRIAVEKESTVEETGLTKIIKYMLNENPDLPTSFDKVEVRKIMKNSGLFLVYKNGDWEYSGETPGKRKVISDPVKKDNKVWNYEELIYELWIKCVMAKVQSAMIDANPRQLFRGFFNIKEKKNRDLIAKGISLLEKAKKVSGTAAKGKSSGNLTNITTGLQNLEDGCLDDMVRVSLAKLENDPNCRVILALNFDKSVRRAVDAFEEADYEVLQVGGKVENKKGNLSSQTLTAKSFEIRRFQEEDGPRILVMTTKSGGTSIDLHDIHGNRKRYMFISPNYVLTDIHQAAGRIFRYGAKTLGEAYIFYGQGGSKASALIESLSTKTTTMRTALTYDELSEAERFKAILLPGEYNRYIEFTDKDGECAKQYSYILDNFSLELNDDGVFERYPKEEFRFIGENTKQGRDEFADTDKLIEYIKTMCKKGLAKNGSLLYTVWVAPDDFDPTRVVANNPSLKNDMTTTVEKFPALETPSVSKTEEVEEEEDEEPPKPIKSRPRSKSQIEEEEEEEVPIKSRPRSKSQIEEEEEEIPVTPKRQLGLPTPFKQAELLGTKKGKSESESESESELDDKSHEVEISDEEDNGENNNDDELDENEEDFDDEHALDEF